MGTERAFFEECWAPIAPAKNRLREQLSDDPAGHPTSLADVSSIEVEGVKGRKLARFDLIPPDALWEVAEVLGWGASNRGDTERNWELGIIGGDGLASAERHLNQWKAREECDEDTGKSHLAHAICNLMFLLSLQMRGELRDTRGPRLAPLRTTTLGYSGSARSGQ